MANVYLHTNEMEQAQQQLYELANMPRLRQISRHAAEIQQLFAEYYRKTNQPDSANKFLLTAYNIRDSLEKRDRQFNSVDVRGEFESREQQNINLSLKKDNAIKTGYLITALVSLGLGIIIITMIWLNLKRKSRYVKKITLLNEEVSRKNDYLLQTLSSLEQSRTENNRIMRVVAHDLKNPISDIRSLIYPFKKNANKQNRDALELIEATCEESITLINELSSNKLNMADVSKELVDMGRLITQCTELFRIKANEKKQQIKLVIEHSMVNVNRQKMWRVISNIVNNAIKFSPENSEIKVCLESSKEHVLVSVHDSGIGIPAEIKGKIFSPDSSISRLGTAGEESHGMGLAISKKIIDEHHGRLWVESEDGKGSVFYVELPYNNN